MQCCLREKNWNPYYAHLIAKLCKSGIPGHKTTLQYCLWDHFKDIDGMDMRQMDNLAKMTATIAAWRILPLKVLKVSELVSGVVPIMSRTIQMGLLHRILDVLLSLAQLFKNAVVSVGGRLDVIE